MASDTRRFFKNILRFALNVFYPAVCPVCGRIGEQISENCLWSVASVRTRRCLECGGAYPCREHPIAPSCCGVSAFDDVNREVIHRMKYSQERRSAVAMGRVMGCIIDLASSDYLVPVPLHKGSARNYNQSELIARGVSLTSGVPVLPVLKWNVKLKNQASKSGEERILPEDAMICRAVMPPLPYSESGAPARVTLIDDVCTTGATLIAARCACEKAGFSVAGAAVWCMARG